MRLQDVAVAVLSTGLLPGLNGCIDHGPVDYTEPTPTGIIFLSAPPQAMAVKSSATLEASYISANGPLGTAFDTPINWAVTCASANACGTLSPSQEVGAMVYAAPVAVPQGGSVTVTASGDGFSVSATITITPPKPIQVGFYVPPPASLDVSATFPLSATIANDTSAEPEVTWSVTCGASACGSFSPTATGAEVPVTFTAPAAIPPGGTVTVTMTSLADVTKTASAMIAITAAPAATLANGTYVFQISGGPGVGASFVTGALVASNGSITGGEQDIANFSGTTSSNAFTATQSIAGGSYGFTPDGNLQISIEAGPGQVETLEGWLAADGHGLVHGLDGVAVSGTLDLQTSTAAPAGGYAVSLSGGDEFYDPTWIGGILNIDGSGAISGTGSLLDVSDPGALETGTLSLSQSTVSAPDTYGRVVLKLYPALGTTFPSIYLAAYTIDGMRMRVVEALDDADTTNFQGVLGGTALAQGAMTGQFGAASIAGKSFVFGGEGIDAIGPLDVAGALTARQDGTVTGLLNWNDQSGTGAQSPLPMTGTYSVDPTGRVTMTDLTDGSTFTYTLHLYLTGNGSGLLQSNDENDVFGGELFEQQAGAKLSGNYGLSAGEWAVNNNTGQTVAANVAGTLWAGNGSGGGLALSGYADAGIGLADFAVTGNLAAGVNAVWTGTLTGFTPGAPANANAFALYGVDGTQAVLIETDNAQLVVGRVGMLP
jgi:hypothetical protein